MNHIYLYRYKKPNGKTTNVQVIWPSGATTFFESEEQARKVIKKWVGKDVFFHTATINLTEYQSSVVGIDNI